MNIRVLLTVLSASKLIYKDKDCYWINGIKLVNKCPQCGKISDYFTNSICDECWFNNQTKLIGGQYL